MEQIDENIIREASEFIGDPDNNFARILAVGQAYKNAGLTPIYLFDESDGTLHVRIEETLGKKLH